MSYYLYYFLGATEAYNFYGPLSNWGPRLLTKAQIAHYDAGFCAEWYNNPYRKD